MVDEERRPTSRLDSGAYAEDEDDGWDDEDDDEIDEDGVRWRRSNHKPIFDDE